MKYLLDTNIFGEPRKRKYYDFDICPGYWSWLISANNADLVCSLDKVKEELIKGNDGLVKWSKEQGDNMFRPMDQQATQELTIIAEWANRESYQPAAIQEFFDVADGYLVAYAKAHDLTLVTMETLSNTPNQIKIPNACASLGVRMIGFFEMLRKEKVAFVTEALSDPPSESGVASTASVE